MQHRSPTRRHKRLRQSIYYSATLQLRLLSFLRHSSTISLASSPCWRQQHNIYPPLPANSSTPSIGFEYARRGVRSYSTTPRRSFSLRTECKLLDLGTAPLTPIACNQCCCLLFRLHPSICEEEHVTVLQQITISWT